LRLAALAQNCGMDGVVCSAQEAGSLRRDRGKGFCLVTPGIRLAGDVSSDQRRVVTPVDAIANGADYLVMGRSITGSADPLGTLKEVVHAVQSIEPGTRS
jgi:orotidine-5'-phosphate decarboxylase